HPEISAKLKKSETRGFKHPVLARLLCPIKHLEDFDANPTELMRKLDNGDILARSRDMPTFAWPRDKYDPEDTDSDLFRNKILLMVWKHIFTSPSSALMDQPRKTKTRSSQAKMHHMESVTPASIAYACIQYIISLFAPDEDGGDSEWSADTIEWWNAKVFGTESRNVDEPENQEGPSTFTIIAEQRRVRKEAKAVVAAAAVAAKNAAAAARAPHSADCHHKNDHGMGPPPPPATSSIHVRHHSRTRSPGGNQTAAAARAPHSADCHHKNDHGMGPPPPPATSSI
ncbi:hypothetical protein CVT25_014179, partial [Psilocybe cyanescens]